MNFSLPSLVVSFIFSAIGFVYWRYGRKMAEMRMMIFGMLLMIFGYFVQSVTWTIVIGAVLAIAPFVLP